MTNRDSMGRVAQDIEALLHAEAELAWDIGAPRPIDSLVEAAARGELPPGHIAFLGQQALR